MLYYKTIYYASLLQTLLPFTLQLLESREEQLTDGESTRLTLRSHENKRFLHGFYQKQAPAVPYLGVGLHKPFEKYLFV